MRCETQPKKINSSIIVCHVFNRLNMRTGENCKRTAENAAKRVELCVPLYKRLLEAL